MRYNSFQELIFHFQSLSEDDKKAFLTQALATPGGEADTSPAPAPETDGTPADAVRCLHCHARPHWPRGERGAAVFLPQLPPDLLRLDGDGARAHAQAAVHLGAPHPLHGGAQNRAGRGADMRHLQDHVVSVAAQDP